MPLNIANPDSELENNNVLVSEVDDQELGAKLVTSPGYIRAVTDVEIGHVWRKTTEIANAAVLTLPTTPVSIIAAPGANKVALLIQAFARLKYTASYTNIDAAGTLRIKRGSDIVSSAILNNSGASITDLNSFLTGSKVGVFELLQTINTTLGNLPKIFTYVANEAHTLDLSNGASGNLTGGNAANELIVVAYYRVIDFTSL